MPTNLASLDSLVHPHQIEVQEFSSYALVIDARSAEAYQEDHIPGAVSVPISAQHQHVGEAGTTGLAARDAEQSAPYALAGHLSGLSAGASVLVYCDRGGLDSLLWANPIKSLGYRVDVLGGGWGNYRRWVDAGLEVLPRALTFRRLLAPPAGGLCRVVDRLMKLGEQVLDLTALAGQRLVPGITLAGDTQPSQAAFETALLRTLRSFDPQRPVWARDGLNGLGRIALPPSLRDALQRSECLWLEVPPTVRVQAWAERMGAMAIDIGGLLQAISVSTGSPSTVLIEHWRSLVTGGRARDALLEIITGYLDTLGQVGPTLRRGHVDLAAAIDPQRRRSSGDCLRSAAFKCWMIALRVSELSTHQNLDQLFLTSAARDVDQQRSFSGPALCALCWTWHCRGAALSPWVGNRLRVG